MQIDVGALLRDQGFTDEDIHGAIERNQLSLLVLESVLLPTGTRYTQQEAAKLAGLDQSMARQFWRALGFPDVPPDEAHFTDQDVAALRGIVDLTPIATDLDVALQLTRLIGSSMARVAEAEVGAAQVSLQQVGTEADGPATEWARAETVAAVAGTQVDAIAGFIDYVHRRALLEAARREVRWESVGTRATSQTLGVGFVDLVGFTALSQQLTDRELAGVVAQFETLAYETIQERGGRVIKTLGDEVMFIAGYPEMAVRTGVDLTRRYHDDQRLSDVRVGLSYGSVLGRDGDYYGPIVNLAHRATNIAMPGTVVCDPVLREAVGEARGLRWKQLRPRFLKGIGRTQLWAVEPTTWARATSATADAAERRIGRRLPRRGR